MSQQKQHSASAGATLASEMEGRRLAAPDAGKTPALQKSADKAVRAPSADGGQTSAGADSGRGGPPHQDAQPRLVRLAEENQRLAEENRGLKAEQRARTVSLFLAGLREGGQLTPAMEQAGAEAALCAAEECGALVSFADGSSAPLGSVLKAVLKAIPPGSHRRDYAREFLDAAPTPALSESEQRIAASLGLSREEYASLKAEG